MRKFALPISIASILVLTIISTVIYIALFKGEASKKEQPGIHGISVKSKVSPTLKPTATVTPSPTVKIRIVEYTKTEQAYLEPTKVPVETYDTYEQSDNAYIPVGGDTSYTAPVEPRDSQGIPCYSNASHCKYECTDADGMIDIWVDNTAFHKDRLQYSTSPERLQTHQDGIVEYTQKLVNSCGEDKVRQWVQ